MDNLPNELCSNVCWVYVQQGNGHTYIIGITYNEDFREREISAGRDVLLWRRFDDTLSAAGYRIVLKRLSAEHLEKIITNSNKM